MSAASKHTVFAVFAVALASLLAAGAPSAARSAGGKDPAAPSRPDNLRVTAATATSVSVAWDSSHDNVGVEGYDVYTNTQRRDSVKETTYTFGGLTCGSTITVGVTAFDAAENRSGLVEAIVSTAACTDAQAPTTPSGFRQAATMQNAVILSWDASTDNVGVVGYEVYRNALMTATPTEPTVTLSGLLCGSIYEYAVDAVDAAGNRSGRGAAFVQTAACSDAERPSTPTGLTITGRTTSSIALAWNASTDNVGVAGYRVSVNDTPVTTTTQRTANVSNLSCGTGYTMAVDAFDAAGNRSLAATVAGSTQACSSGSSDTTPPSVPTGVATSGQTQTSLAVSWNASTDNVGVTGYNVYKAGVKIATTTSLGYTYTGLTCGTHYVVGVSAIDAAGNESSVAAAPNSDTLACATPPPADTSGPTQPTGLAVTAATSTSISIRWSASTDNVAVAGYGVYRDGIRISTASQLSASVAGLTCGRAYTIGVDAYDAAGNRSSRSDVIATTSACPDTQAPTVPASVTASSRTATSIALSWLASSDNVGVVGYGLYRAGSLVGSTNGTTGIFSGLTCDTLYTLAVDAYDAAGNRSNQSVVMVSTTPCPDTTAPSTPTGLAATNVAQTSLTLGWNASSDNVAVTGYDVYRNGTKIGAVSSTSSSQTGLTCGTAYTLGVEAYDAAGNRSPRAQMNASTSACAAPVTPTYTSSISDGATVQRGVMWSATVSPTPNSVEFWASSTSAGDKLLKTDVGPGYDVVLDVPAGSYILGICVWYGSSRTCFPDRKNVTVTETAPAPSLPSGGTTITKFCDVDNTWGTPIVNRFYSGSDRSQPLTGCNATGQPWPSGGGLWEVSTPYGPGFKFVVTDEMWVQSGGKIAALMDMDHLIDYQNFLGQTQDWSGMFMFPGAGNPNGFPRGYGDWNALIEFHTEQSEVYNQIGIDTRNQPTDHLYMRCYDPSAPAGNSVRKAVDPNPIRYDHWYSWRIRVKWSYGSDGRYEAWLDGVKMIDYTGPTTPTGTHPYFDVDYYSAVQLRNEVWHAALRKG